MNVAKDLRLMSIAFWLDATEFDTQLNSDELDKVNMLWRNDAKARGMTRLPRGGVFLVQFSMSGKSVIVGKVSSDKTVKGFEKAVRFSDMARQYFSKYRMPDPRSTLNFSTWRVTEDLKRELKMVHILQALEKHLLEKGAIRVITRTEEIKAELKSEAPVRLIDVLAAVKELGEKSNRLAAVVASHSVSNGAPETAAINVGGQIVITDRLDAMKSFVEDVSKQLTAIREQNAVMIQVLKIIVERLTPMKENSEVCCSPVVGVIKTGV